MGEPTAMSSWPRVARSSTWKAASSAMKSVTPSRWHSALSASDSARGQRARAACAPRKRLHGGRGPVGGQLQRGGRAGELLLPVASCALQHLALQPLALPDGVVRVLDRQRGQRRGLARGEGRVERAPARAPARPWTSRRRRCGASSAAARAPRRASAQQRARAAAGPCARSKGCCASSRPARRTSASRVLEGAQVHAPAAAARGARR